MIQNELSRVIEKGSEFTGEIEIVIEDRGEVKNIDFIRIDICLKKQIK